MKIKSSPANNTVLNHVRHENVVRQWLETTADFYIYYTKLTNCLREKTASENLSRITHSFIGQTSVKQIVDLVRVMEVELEILLIDMDCLETVDPLGTDKEYRKLDRHTRLLKKLNQQANTALLLTTLTGKTILNELATRPN